MTHSVEPLVRYTSGSTRVTFHTADDSTRQAISRSLACAFSSTIPEWKERLLVVYYTEVRYIGICSIHFTKNMARLKNVVRYTRDFVIKGYAISEIHCIVMPLPQKFHSDGKTMPRVQCVVTQHQLSQVFEQSKVWKESGTLLKVLCHLYFWDGCSLPSVITRVVSIFIYLFVWIQVYHIRHA